MNTSAPGRTAAGRAGVPGETAGGHRPQSLVFSFFGGVVAGRDLPPVPTSVFLQLFDELGVAEAAVRATLARMTRREMLTRVQVGRVAQYRLSVAGDALISRARQRVHAPAPFEHPPDRWTLLSYSLPESHRDLRQRLRAALSWAGFGGLRDGVWIAPGTVDVREILADAGLSELADMADWFAASPAGGGGVEDLIRRTWPVEDIRQRHHEFIRTWETWPAGEDPLAQVTRLGADWLQLLRVDPGLPAAVLAPAWPAPDSAAVYRRCYETWLPAAQQRLDAELRAAQRRPG